MRLPSLWRLPDYSLPVLVILTLAAALLWTPADSALAKDAAGPKIADGPTIASSPESGDTYRAGETITVEVTFSEPVTVTGKPRLRLNIGGKKRWAKYDSTGADGATLSFTHTVKLSAQDADGVSIGRNQLRLNGGKIKDAEDNAAKLKHPALPDQAGHKVNGSPDESPMESEPEPTPTPAPTPTPTTPSNNEPQFADNTAARSVDENTAAGENLGAAVTAEDDDGDSLTYALTGADAGSFDFDTSTGQLTVKAALNYEARASYAVTVTVHDGKDTAGEADTGVDDTIAVTVSVLNVDEAGVVSLLTENNAFEVGNEISAVLLDPDGGVTGETWTWQHSTDSNEWIAIASATGAAYTPTADDADHYLRATVSYTDGQGSGKSARAQTTATVAAVVAANPVSAQPQQSVAPAAPTGFLAHGGFEYQVPLDWSNPNDSTITKYQYRYKKVADSATVGAATADSATTGYTPWIDLAGSDSATISERVCLPGGAKYRFELRAVNANGPSTAAGYITTAVTGAALTSPTGFTVTTDSVVIPSRSGLDVGDRFRVMFLSDSPYTSTAVGAAVSSDIAHYNSCAAGEALSESRWSIDDRYLQFRALVSTRTMDARVNTATTYTDSDKGVPIYWVDGPKVADDYEDFYDGSWDNSTARDQSGLTFSDPVLVWTGSKANGTKHASNYAGATQVAYGKLENPALGGPGTETLYKGAAASTTERPTYVLSPVITIVVPPREPAAPANLVAVTGNGQVTLTWDDPKNASITKYQYFVRTRTGANSWDKNTLADSDYVDIPGSDATTTRAVISTLANGTTLTNGTSYSFTIRAVNNIGSSIHSSRVMIPHAQPSGITSSPHDGDTYKRGEVITVRINLRFPAFITGNPTLPISIGIGPTPPMERRATCSGLPGTGTLAAALPTSSVALVCKYRVQADDTDTDGIHVRADSLTVPSGVTYQSITPGSPIYTNTRFAHPTYRPSSTQKVDGSQFTPLARPTGFTATAGDAQVALAWTDPDNPVITKWQYRHKVGSGNAGSYGDWADVPSSDDTTTSRDVTGLDNDKTYTFQVRAAIGDTTGPASAEQSARPAASPIWSATLTVDKDDDYHGCDNEVTDHDDCSTTAVLSDDDFVYGGITYTIDAIYWDSADDVLTLAFDTTVSHSTVKRALSLLTLHSGSSVELSFASADATDVGLLTWPVDLNWSDNDVVTLSLQEEEPRITDIRLKDNDSRFGVPINLINRGLNLIIEVEYDRELPYSSLPQAFPLMLGSFGGSANSEEELRKMGYKGEPSNTDPNIRYAELVPDRESKCCNTASGEVADDSKCACKSNHQALCVDVDTPANPQTDCACWYHHWEMKPVISGKVVTYKYTVRWGDLALDDDGVSIVRPDTGAVMTFPQKVNGRY